jgi:hypothetical protein
LAETRRDYAFSVGAGRREVRPPDLPKAPPRSLNAVVDFFHTGGDGLLARAKFGRPLDSSARGIDDPPPAARLDLFNVVINRPMLHGLERINAVTVFKMEVAKSKTQLPCLGSGTHS